MTGKPTQRGQGWPPGNGLTERSHNPLNKYVVHWRVSRFSLNTKQKGRDLPWGGFSGPGRPPRPLGSSCACPRGCPPANTPASDPALPAALAVSGGLAVPGGAAGAPCTASPTAAPRRIALCFSLCFFLLTQRAAVINKPRRSETARSSPSLPMPHAQQLFAGAARAELAVRQTEPARAASPGCRKFWSSL